MKAVGSILLAVCEVAVCGALVAPVAAQDVPRGIRTSRGIAPSPRLMIANPFVTNQQDSAASVEIGNFTRTAVQEMVGDDYNIVTQDQMNEALSKFGYPVDAILTNSLAIELAKTGVAARTIITSELTKTDGRYTLTARLAGVNDEAGYVVVVNQPPQERFMDFGYRIADSLRSPLKSLADSRTCFDEMAARPERAAKAAEKALKRVPNYGLANICLLRLTFRQDSAGGGHDSVGAAKDSARPSRDSLHRVAIQYLESAIKGDPQSVIALRWLANSYNAVRDTAKALAAYQRLLRIAPSDQELRERIFRFYIETKQPKLALEVIEEGLKIDPYNPDLYDLKANACLFLQDFTCAVESLERLYAADSTKADSTFFRKITMALRQIQPLDTLELVRWGQIGAARYPDNVILLEDLNRTYLMAGQIDSSIAVTLQLIVRNDSSAVQPALVLVHALAKANRLAEASQFVSHVKTQGKKQEKETLSMVLISSARIRLEGDTVVGKQPDPSGAAELARVVVEIADTAGEGSAYGNLILGTALLQQANKIDDEAEAQKSCELTRQEQQLLNDARAAFTRARRSSKLQSQAEKYLAAANGFTPRITQMLKMYCE